MGRVHRAKRRLLQQVKILGSTQTAPPCLDVLGRLECANFVHLLADASDLHS